MRMTAAQQLHRSCATEGVGAIAQLGERLRGTQEVGGSIPPSSTNSLPASAGDWRTLLARRPRGIVEELVEKPRWRRAVRTPAYLLMAFQVPAKNESRRHDGDNQKRR